MPLPNHSNRQLLQNYVQDKEEYYLISCHFNLFLVIWLALKLWLRDYYSL